jgi:hypothetical protein
VPKLFGVTLFLSATLLFLVQPMVGKMILPLLGGTPAVWNSCMVFFQALLLAGYYYAHKNTTRLPTRRQVAVHTGVLLVAAGALAVGAALAVNHSPVPVVKSLAPQGSSVPFFGVIALLAVAIGLPFFTVSTTAPLLQKWFSETGHPSAKDPYFLYAASNFGSLLALVAYPFVVEPNLRLVEQAWVWAIGFLVMVGAILVCGNAVKKAPPALAQVPTPKRPVPPAAAEEPVPHWTTKLRWLFLAAVPSSLMLATTTDVTTDIVSMPLLWVVPLALYLLTFIIVFSKSIPPRLHLYVTLMTPVLILLVVFLRASHNVPRTELNISFKLNLALSLVTFFFVALTCHGELARTRPSARHLTEFYLIMSVGGMLGGLFNALVAPLVFTFVSEYPISLVAACFLLPPLSRLLNPEAPPEPRRWTIWDLVLPLLFFAAGRFLSAYFTDIVRACASVMDDTGFRLRARGALFDDARTAATILAFGLPTLACYFLVERPLRFGACVAALWFGTYFTFVVNDRKMADEDRTIYTRSFFGTIKVTTDYNRSLDGKERLSPFTQLVHGTTVHGAQYRDEVPYETSLTQALWLAGANGPADALGLAYVAQPHFEFPGREPLTYYTRSGPVGVMFDVVRNREAGGKPTDVACIGLGTGTLSAYGRPGQKMTFFEIDWTVRNLVESDRHFTYVARAKAQKIDIEFLMGDARLSLEQVDRKWGFMLVDAFSSDSIPAHLLTKEAVELYFNRLTDNGLLALHISNRYLKLEPVVDRIVNELQLSALVMHDFTLDATNHDQPEYSGKLSSTWVVVGRNAAALDSFRADGRWFPLKGDPKVGLWTDDYTPLKSVLQGEWNLFGE